MATTTYNYFLVLTQSAASREALSAIFNISETARAYFDYGNTSWWILPKSRKEIDEAKAMLDRVSEIQKFQMVNLNSVNNDTVEKVRGLLKEFQFDTSGINDSEFILYLNAIIERKFDYYIDIPDARLQPYPAKIVVKLLKEHPAFSPDWLEEKQLPIDENVDREYTIDDFEIIHECVALDPFDETNEDNPWSGDQMKSNDDDD